MELLPSLAVEQILGNLDVKDVLACSSVNVGWRSSVNNDHVWKKFCFRVSDSITIGYLQTVSPKITPLFEVPDSARETLEPLCYWRVVYMKLQHVKRNWCTGNHETYKVTELDTDHFDFKVDNEVLIANVNDNMCEVWNIRGRPQKREVIVCALENPRGCSIHVSADRIAIVQDTLLQIYHEVGNKFVLKYRRLFNEPESLSETIPSSVNIDDWYYNFIQQPICLSKFHVGKYFIGLAHNKIFRQASFHVWDTISGSKLTEETVETFCSNPHDPVCNIEFCSSKSELDKIIFYLHHLKQRNDVGEIVDYNDYCVVYVYDLKFLTSKKLLVLKPHVSQIYFEGNFIVTVGHCDKTLSVYSSVNGNALISQTFSNEINDSVQIHRDLLGFTVGGDLMIWNLKNFDLVFTTAIIKGSSYLFDFEFIDWNLILMCHQDKVKKIEVWSVDRKRLLSTLNAPSGFLYHCNNSTKFFVWNEMDEMFTINMLQFW